jgi:uncharacterized small protein (DUF1192 family)
MDWLDDAPKKKTHDFPRVLDGLSIEELDAYTQALNTEIARVAEDRAAKLKARSAADAIFGTKA